METDTTRKRHARKGPGLPSDLTDGEWEILEPFLPPPSHVGRPRKWPMRRIVDAMLYLLRGGLPWRMLGALVGLAVGDAVGTTLEFRSRDSYSAQESHGQETANFGIADALSLTPEGNPLVVIDWKSDVAPDAKTLDHYRCQVQAYLEITGAERGLIVLMTSGQIISVAREVTAGLG